MEPQAEYVTEQEQDDLTPEELARKLVDRIWPGRVVDQVQFVPWGERVLKIEAHGTMSRMSGIPGLPDYSEVIQLHPVEDCEYFHQHIMIGYGRVSRIAAISLSGGVRLDKQEKYTLPPKHKPTQANSRPRHKSHR
jgi:hypothetical protein